MEKKSVLVTGVGGNVGQGIIRNIRASGFPINVVGTNTTSFSSGNHLCDIFYTIPYAYDQDYITTIVELVKKERIDLIIPSTDYEVYYLAKHKDQIPCRVVVSEVETAEIYLDKYKTYLHHQQYDIPFAESYLPSRYDGRFEEIIVKPREGRGSRGVVINPVEWRRFSDDFMIQQLCRGSEFTTAFYVNRRGELHGFITLERKLENGATTECRVNTSYDAALKPILQKIVQYSDIKGSANLQSIITSSGQIFPFEINCRISGTNSIRSNFGFEDVKYTIEEFLYDVLPSTPKITQGVAVRIMMDVIYPNQSNSSYLRDNSAVSYLF